ncbi:hypothetical protein EES39_34140 [Streptomyces sp. ADI92-24]|nr:hypothetical protein EES39_34140 [Streptomyces sp. ADI92-24]
MKSASRPPMRKNANEVTRYIVPMVLWSVVVIHLMTTFPGSLLCTGSSLAYDSSSSAVPVVPVVVTGTLLRLSSAGGLRTWRGAASTGVGRTALPARRASFRLQQTSRVAAWGGPAPAVARHSPVRASPDGSIRACGLGRMPGAARAHRAGPAQPARERGPRGGQLALLKELFSADPGQLPSTGSVLETAPPRLDGVSAGAERSEAVRVGEETGPVPPSTGSDQTRLAIAWLNVADGRMTAEALAGSGW